LSITNLGLAFITN